MAEIKPSTGATASVLGTCLCGRIRWEVEAAELAVEYCHCSRCRKAQGSAFSANAAIPAEALRILAGADALASYAASSHRSKCFCRHCGSSVFIRRTNSTARMALHCGALEGHAKIVPARHVFVASKAPWYPLAGDLPQYPVYPGMSEEPPSEPLRANDSLATRRGPLQGSCFCARVAYRLPGRVFFLNHCHCAMCRRFTGSAFGSYLHADGAGFVWVRGEDEVSTYQSSPGNQRAFCRHCGGKLPVIEEDGAHAIIPAGSLESDPGIFATAQFFGASKAPWFTITDPAPVYEEFPPESFWTQWD